MRKIKTVAAHTLGCKVNQYDTDTLLAACTARGFTVRDFNDPADLYIINTCTVTQTGDRKSRQMIRRARRLNPEAVVAACGCMTKLSPETAGQSGADIVFDARDADSLFHALSMLDAQSYDHDTDTGLLPVQRRTRAHIKIQEGCDRFCAYCIVPYARGPVVSRPTAEIMAEASDCANRGVLEIVLTGIHVASYGKDLTDSTLPALLEQVADIDGLTRVRLGSIEPYAVDDLFIKTVEKLPRICGHFHLSLQSGCDRTLKHMNRRYTAAAYAEAALRLRNARPDASLTTDVIVGFPGETDEDFEESLRFVSDLQFARTHVFEYSPRPGTPAATFPNQVASAVKAERSQRMRALTDEMTRIFLDKHIGSTAAVLYESEQNGWWEGHTANYITVRVRSRRSLFNCLEDTRLEQTAEGGLMTGTLSQHSIGGYL